MRACCLLSIPFQINVNGYQMKTHKRVYRKKTKKSFNRFRFRNPFTFISSFSFAHILFVVNIFVSIGKKVSDFCFNIFCLNTHFSKYFLKTELSIYSSSIRYFNFPINFTENTFLIHHMMLYCFILC